jgi:hypothetical protein
MEISREQALKCLNSWKDRGTLVGLYFAARGGTAFSTMLARITEVGATLVFRNEATLLRYALLQARFEFRPVQVFLKPSREGMREIDGLHITLESGHWLFVCDGEGVAQDWLAASGIVTIQKKSGGLLESQAEQKLVAQES